MADVFTKAERSKVMAAVRSRGNRDTELKLAAILRAHGITGWRRQQPMRGKPDFVFRREQLAVFVDGCFWHGCPIHGECQRKTKSAIELLPVLGRIRGSRMRNQIIDLKGR